jgi:hypothetical protein
MRLYAAICGWLEAHAASMSAEPAQHEPQPEGNNFAQAEHAHAYTSAPELHAGYSTQSIDDDQGGVYRTRPIGFRRNN